MFEDGDFLEWRALDSDLPYSPFLLAFFNFWAARSKSLSWSFEKLFRWGSLDLLVALPVGGVDVGFWCVRDRWEWRVPFEVMEREPPPPDAEMASKAPPKKDQTWKCRPLEDWKMFLWRRKITVISVSRLPLRSHKHWDERNTSNTDNSEPFEFCLFSTGCLLVTVLSACVSISLRTTSSTL